MTALRELLRDRLGGQDPGEWANALRAGDGKKPSWDRLARMLEAQTGREVSGETLRLWSLEPPEPGAS